MDIQEAGEKFIEKVIPMDDGCRQVHVPRHRNGMYSDVSSTKCPVLVSYYNNGDSFWKDFIMKIQKIIRNHLQWSLCISKIESLKFAILQKC